MTNIERILIPVDFSDCSREALGYGLFLAKHFGANVDLLHAWTAPSYVSPYLAVRIETTEDGPETLETVARREAAAQMAAILDGVEIPEGVELGTRIEFGIDSDVIQTTAKDYDLIVMGTHGRAGLPHFFMGSVAEKVIRSSVVPVVTVRSKKAKGAS